MSKNFDKEINIFIASSINDFEMERLSISNLIYKESRQLEVAYNVRITPLMCEENDDAVSYYPRKQEEYNEMIRNSKIVIVLCFNRMNKYTMEEFEVAYNERKNGKDIKIYTFFKKLDNNIKLEESFNEFKKKLKSIEHFYSTFTHVDTIKINIYRFILRLILGESKIEEKLINGKLYFNGNEVNDININNVEEFYNNIELSNLLNKYNELDKEYQQLKPKHDLKLLDEKDIERYINISGERNRIKKRIDDLQTKILNISKRFHNEMINQASPRKEEAFRLFEQGKTEEALILLDTDTIVDEFEQKIQVDKKIAQLYNDRVLNHARNMIDEISFKIEVLHTLIDDTNRIKKIEIEYEKIVEKVKEYKVRLIELYNYAEFIYNYQPSRIDIAIGLVELLIKGVYEGNESLEKSSLYNFMGLMYSSRLKNMPMAQEYYSIAVKLAECQYQNNKKDFAEIMARCYHNLAGVYRNDKLKCKNAEYYYNKSLEIKKQLYNSNPEKHGEMLANTYNNLALLYTQNEGIFKRSNADIVKLYNSAIEIDKRLYNVDNIKYGDRLSRDYSNLALLYQRENNFEKAIELFQESIKIDEKLFIINDEQFGEGLIISYNNCASLYRLEKKYFEEAENYYMKAIKTGEMLSKKHDIIYKDMLAICYNNLAELYKFESTHQFESENYYIMAITLMEELSGCGDEKYIKSLALFNKHLSDLYLNNLGGVLNKKEEYKKYLDKAIELDPSLSNFDNEKRNLIIS